MSLINRLPVAHAIIDKEPHLFRPGFRSWLNVSGWAIYTAFEYEALRVARRREHWAANTIVEWMRHETMLRDEADAEFKISDQWTSSMARLFARLNPAHAEFFEYRERANGVVALP
jgi:hypothetical protein